MVTFIKTFFYSILLPLFLSVVLVLSIPIILKPTMNFRINENKNVLCVGNSVGLNGVNDAILTNWKNICHDAARYILINGELKEVLDQNSKIDTVVITAGLPTFRYSEIPGHFELNLFQNFRSQILFLDTADKYELAQYSDFLAFLATDFLISLRVLPTFDINENHYRMHNKTENLFNLESNFSVYAYQKSLEQRKGKAYSMELLKKINYIQCYGIKKMLKICKEHQVVPVLLNGPCYHLERYYDDSGYRQFVKELGDSILVADYTDFQFPDKSYYQDVHHLNTKGGNYFSAYIKKHGLKLQYAIDYYQRNAKYVQ